MIQWIHIDLLDITNSNERTSHCGLERRDGVHTPTCWLGSLLGWVMCLTLPRSQWGHSHSRGWYEFKVHQDEEVSFWRWLSSGKDRRLRVEHVQQLTCCRGVTHTVMWGSSRHIQPWNLEKRRSHFWLVCMKKWISVQALLCPALPRFSRMLFHFSLTSRQVSLMASMSTLRR